MDHQAPYPNTDAEGGLGEGLLQYYTMTITMTMVMMTTMFKERPPLLDHLER